MDKLFLLDAYALIYRSYYAFRQSMSNKDISMFMEAQGFKKIHRKTGNGWKVIEMRPDEIENNQKMDGSENIPPGDLPF